MNHSYSREKAARVGFLLSHYEEEVSGDIESAFTDILTDLRHAAEEVGVDFEVASEISGRHFAAERPD